MLAKMSSLNEVGVYSIGFRFASIIVFITGAFGQAWSPYAIKIKSDHPDTYKEFYSYVLSILFFIVLVVGGGLCLFAGEIIGLLMPLSYESSSYSMILLTFGVILQSTTQVTALGISLEGKTRLFSRISWMTALINFILNYILIPKFGAVGASIATTVSYFTLTLGYVYYTQKIHPLPFNWRLLVIQLTLGLAVLFTSLYFVSTSLNTSFIAIKLGVSLVCLIIVVPMLPIKNLKNFS